MPTFRNRPLDLVLDVRSKLEFFLGHLDGAENIPVDRLPEALEGKDGVKKSSRILVYCASGMRSAQAAHLLKAAGYSNVVDGGGMSDARGEYQSS
jgi:phage shock protein E